MFSLKKIVFLKRFFFLKWFAGSQRVFFLKNLKKTSTSYFEYRKSFYYSTKISILKSQNFIGWFLNSIPPPSPGNCPQAPKGKSDPPSKPSSWGNTQSPQNTTKQIPPGRLSPDKSTIKEAGEKSVKWQRVWVRGKIDIFFGCPEFEHAIFSYIPVQAG